MRNQGRIKSPRPITTDEQQHMQKAPSRRKGLEILMEGRASPPACLTRNLPYLPSLTIVIPPAPGCFSALAFLTASVFSTHSSAVFKSAAPAAGLSHGTYAPSRFIRL